MALVKTLCSLREIAVIVTYTHESERIYAINCFPAYTELLRNIRVKITVKLTLIETEHVLLSLQSRVFLNARLLVSLAVATLA